MGCVEGQSIVPYNSVLPKTENAKVCVSLTIFTSIVEALNNTNIVCPKTNGDVWIILLLHVIHIRSYQIT
jgi:hypothetical protein